MMIENQGGLEARINEVLVINVDEELNEEDDLAYRCSWIVKGEIGHWGHDHRRINRYDAIISLKPIEGLWKMTGLDIIEEVRM